jgi:predicted ATPase
MAIGALPFHQALRIAQEQEALLWELRAALSLARRCVQHHRGSEVRQILAPV